LFFSFIYYFILFIYIKWEPIKLSVRVQNEEPNGFQENIPELSGEELSGEELSGEELSGEEPEE